MSVKNVEYVKNNVLWDSLRGFMLGNKSMKADLKLEQVKTKVKVLSMELNLKE